MMCCDNCWREARIGTLCEFCFKSDLSESYDTIEELELTIGNLLEENRKLKEENERLKNELYAAWEESMGEDL